MDIKQSRTKVVHQSIEKIKRALDDGVSVERLEVAKSIMLKLASQQDLFPFADFPTPDKVQIERTDLIHEEPDGSFALYVNSSQPGQQSLPHDHGGAWAIVAAVHGEEQHRLYAEAAADSGRLLDDKGTLTVKPGTAISLLPEGIHSIHAVSDKPLMHLHLYGECFRNQGERKEYDLERGRVKTFVLEDLGFIEDKR